MTLFGWFRKSNRPQALSPSGAAPSEPAPAVPDPTTGAAPPTLSPDEVRRRLFDAVAAGDDQRLEALCREHRNLILSHGAAWLEVPAPFRSTSEAYDWYQQGLRAIARFCADRVDHAQISEPDATSTPTAAH
jgi:hypothetical protein